MKHVLTYLFCVFNFFSFSQELVENFEQLPDSTKNQVILNLLLENRKDTSFENQVNRIKEIADFCRFNEDLPTEGLAVVHLYVIYIEQGKYSQSEEISNLIQKKYYAYLLPRNQMNLNMYRAEPLMSQGKSDEAIEIALETLAICEENDLPKNNVYGLLSTIYISLGKFEDALEMDKKNLAEILEYKRKEYGALGQAYYSISRDYAGLNRYDSSSFYGAKSLDYWGHPVSYLHMGDVKLALEEFDSVRFYLAGAKEIIESSPMWKFIETSLYVKLSRLEIMEQNWAEGLQYSEKVLEGALKEGDAEITHKAYENIILGHLKENGNYLTNYLTQDTILRNQRVTALTVEMTAKYETVEKEKEILTLNNDIQKQEIETLRFRNYLQYAGSILMVFLVLLYLFFRWKKVKSEREIESLRKKALQLQMNPHFFFNSLNSINNFIGENNTEEAQKYLVNFSKLMRLTLENSQENLVSIRKELDFLNNFLILERLRSKNFDFEINVAEDLKEFKIPSFLIQPLVENSLLHGFSKIAYKGCIKISIEKRNGLISVSVIDNGIGRTKSMQSKKEDQKHHSFGFEILKQRISAYTGKTNTVSIKNGIAVSDNLGTAVTFEIPLFS